MSRYYPLPVLLAAFLAWPGVSAARKERLELSLYQLELPGAPAALVPADLDGDGVRDLAVVIAYTQWDQIAISERSEMTDVAGLVVRAALPPNSTRPAWR